MPQARGFLNRFRAAGIPGSAARAGVPADRSREQLGELEPVLAVLDDVHAECAEIIRGATRQASLLLEQARPQAAGIIAGAEREGRAARQEVTAQVLTEARAIARQEAGAARREAAEILRLSQARMAGLVAKAVELARSGPGELMEGPP